MWKYNRDCSLCIQGLHRPSTTMSILIHIYQNSPDLDIRVSFDQIDDRATVVYTVEYDERANPYLQPLASMVS
jgi:hypothetical protein